MWAMGSSHQCFPWPGNTHSGNRDHRIICYIDSWGIVVYSRVGSTYSTSVVSRSNLGPGWRRMDGLIKQPPVLPCSPLPPFTVNLCCPWILSGSSRILIYIFLINFLRVASKCRFLPILGCNSGRPTVWELESMPLELAMWLLFTVGLIKWP